MKAAWLEAFGGPADVKVTDRPAPVPGAGEVLVDVHAAAVNYPDLLVMSNGYQLSAQPPFTPGSEFAGVVVAAGSGVTEFAPGQHVAGSAFVGAFAEQACAPVGRLRHKPPELDWVDAAAYGATGTTAYHALVTVGRLRPDHVVAVLGAAGGVGSACLGMARLLGARAVGVVSSSEKERFALAQGAHEVVNYRSQDLREGLRAVAPDGTDLVIDPVGGSCSVPALRSLRRGGSFVVVGFASGDIPRVPLNLVLVKGLQIVGVDVRTLREQHPEVIAEGNAEIGGLIRRGWRPAIDTVFPLDKVAEALTRVADGQALGKVVVTVR